MFNFKMCHCNNIAECKIEIKKATLNIFYAMNGTGKSTIGKALELVVNGDSLDELKPFHGEETPSGLISENINSILLFNEEFVNTIVFKESEVIENAFDVFIKSQKYDDLQTSINKKLSKIHFDPNTHEQLGNLYRVGESVINKFSVTNSGELKKTGLLKSLVNSKSIFSLPKQLKKFQPLMEKAYNTDWVGWKNDGGQFDDNEICPFCANILETDYPAEKEIFSSSYSKSSVKSIREMIGYFDSVKEYMNPEKVETLYKCIKELKDESVITLWVKKFYHELLFLISKVKSVIDFNSFLAHKEDISKLEEQLNNLKIDISALEIFNSEKVKLMVDSINSEVTSLLKETDILKSNIGELNGYIGSATKKAVNDINEFLFMAGINYELEIKHLGENKTQSILKYRANKQSDAVIVSDIKRHLSWGERNAFALVLFMHYALSRKPEIIILDDPISSFDNNKKYAIINRLFANMKDGHSFFRKTVIMLTHDFQPVIDFISVGKPNELAVVASYMRNNNGKIGIYDIKDEDIVSLPILLSENAKNSSLNPVHRITCIRKLLEHTNINRINESSYNVLSSLLHGKIIPTYLNESAMPEIEIQKGEAYIQTFIPDFLYNKYYTDYFKKELLVKHYIEETSSYFKLQIFRVLLIVYDLKSKVQNDPLMKYIDEQFHVENDNIFYLNICKYDLVPDFVIPACNNFLTELKIIS